MRYVFVLFLFLSACGGLFEGPPVVSIEPALQEYVDNFLVEGASRGHPIQITDLIVRFSPDLGDNVLGECWTGGSSTPTIYISMRYWPYETVVYRRIIMFHELGHCVLNREHELTGRIRNGYCTPSSIMWPYIIDETNMYLTNWNDYMVELFTGVSTGPLCSFNNYWGGT